MRTIVIPFLLGSHGLLILAGSRLNRSHLVIGLRGHVHFIAIAMSRWLLLQLLIFSLQGHVLVIPRNHLSFHHAQTLTQIDGLLHQVFLFFLECVNCTHQLFLFVLGQIRCFLYLFQLPDLVFEIFIFNENPSDFFLVSASLQLLVLLE